MAPIIDGDPAGSIGATMFAYRLRIGRRECSVAALLKGAENGTGMLRLGGFQSGVSTSFHIQAMLNNAIIECSLQ